MNKTADELIARLDELGLAWSIIKSCGIVFASINDQREYIAFKSFDEGTPLTDVLRKTMSEAEIQVEPKPRGKVMEGNDICKHPHY